MPYGRSDCQNSSPVKHGAPFLTNGNLSSRDPMTRHFGGRKSSNGPFDFEEQVVAEVVDRHFGSCGRL